MCVRFQIRNVIIIISGFSIIIYFSFIVLVTKQLEEVMYFEFSYEELMLRYENKMKWLELLLNGHLMVSKLCVHLEKIKHSSLFGWLVLE